MSRTNPSSQRLLRDGAVSVAFAALVLLAWSASVHAHEIILAQARNPFDVGIREGGAAPANGVIAWILAQQTAFERLLSGAVRGVASDKGAFWSLMSISFAYGVFHAAGPGHGKAVVASYMFANERSLRRGLVISGLAAVLQGLVAVTVVGVMALVLNATAARMREAAHLVELASYAGVAALGAWLTWRKGRVLAAALGFSVGARGDHGECGHFHAPDPGKLGDGMTWRSAAGAVFAAGARPCSGAILVLVFALAQGVFLAGALATFAMSAGTAITTGALAAVAVGAKGLAVRFLGDEGGGRGVVLVRSLEFVAAAFVFLLGASLLLGATLGAG